MKNRIENLRKAIKEQNLDAMIIGSFANYRYLSGFSGSNAMLYISEDKLAVVTDFRYLEQVSMEAPSFECFDQGSKGLFSTTVGIIKSEGAKRVGFESKHITYSDYLLLNKESEFELVPTKNIVEDIRSVKNEDELEKIRRAEAIGDIAFTEVIKFIQDNWKNGITENQVALKIEQEMRKQGASGLSFDTIVATGAKSSLCHAQPGENKLSNGDFVVMDFGCIYEGYCSDMTRTIAIGEASEEMVKIYNVVLEAQKAALDMIKPGLKGKEVDAVARNIISEAGYGKYFGHGLGHSVGLEIHESPRFSTAEEKVIETGMVITVEPGIYVPGLGGVRIEDVVAITDTGIDNFTNSPKELIIIK